MVQSLTASSLTAGIIRQWVALAAEVLSHNAEMLNGLNVFPVADSDTGSNLAASMRGAAVAIAEVPDGATASQLLAVAAQGALRAGRGNSGVILSEWLRGFAQSFQKSDSVAEALQQAASSAHDAVAKPAPGTILTAAQAAADGTAADGASDSAPNGEVSQTVEAALVAARAAAEKSSTILAALARAGVDDAGACGLVLVLGALKEVLNGGNNIANIELGFDPFEADTGSDPGQLGATEDGGWQEGDDADEDGFEVMFTLRRPAGAKEFETGQVAAQLRRELAEIGNSVVVVGGLAVGDATKDSEWHSHVHVSDLSAALQLIDRWRQKGVVAAIQVRHLAVPAGDLNLWVTTNDPALIAEYARGGAVVLVPSGGTPVSDDVISAVKASPTTANIVLAAPGDVAAVSAGLTYPTDLILGPDNAAAQALLLMVAGDQVSAGTEIDAVRECFARLVCADTGLEPTGLPGVIAEAIGSGLVVAAVPVQEPPMALEAAREQCEAAGAELVVIERSDRDPVIHWATERPDAN